MLFFWSPVFPCRGPTHPLYLPDSSLPRSTRFVCSLPLSGCRCSGGKHGQSQSWLPSGPKPCFLIPRTLDTGTHCLKVLFVSPVGQYALFDLFYSFVIMGYNGLGCLNIRVITFHSSYPSPSKRGTVGKVRNSLEKEGCALPSCSSRPGLGIGSQSGHEKHEALAVCGIQESQLFH